MDLLTDNSDEPNGLAAYPTPSSPVQSSQISAPSSKVETFLLLEALLSFLHSAVGSVYVIRFRIHIYNTCTLHRRGRMINEIHGISVAPCSGKCSFRY